MDDELQISIYLLTYPLEGRKSVSIETDKEVLGVRPDHFGDVFVEFRLAFLKIQKVFTMETLLR